MVFAGDTRQQQPVEAGPGLRLIRDAVGSVRVDRIRRQRPDLEDILVHVHGETPPAARFRAGLMGEEERTRILSDYEAMADKPAFTPWQVAVSEALRDGDAAQAIQAWHERGRFHLGFNEERTLRALVDEWERYTRQHPEKSSVVLARTRAEARALSHLMRERRFARRSAAGDAAPKAVTVHVSRGTEDDRTASPLEIAVGDRLRIGAKRDIERQIEERLHDAVGDLYRRLGEAVERVSERLQEDEDGKPLVFRNSMIENIRDLVDVVPRLNIFGDDRLALLCQDVKDRIAHADPDTRFLSRQEIGRLHRVLDIQTGKRNTQQADIIRLLLLTGCRKSEIVQLRWSEVQNDKLVLDDSKTGPRNVPLNSQARRVLNRQPGGGSAFVFPSPLNPSRPRGAHLTLWYRVRREAGIEDARLHDLRHSHASHAVMNGVPVPVVSRLLGHSNVRMTLRYAHLGDREIEAAAERVGQSIAAVMGL